MKIAYEGWREPLPLRTPNKAAAAARTRGVYLSRVANGWEPTLTTYKKQPKTVAPAPTAEQQPCTAGKFLDAIFRTTTNYWSEALCRSGTRTRVGSFLTLHGPDLWPQRLTR